MNNETNPIVVVRLITSRFFTSRGIAVRKDLRFLKSKCSGHNFLDEDAAMVGTDCVIRRITNIDSCKDGIYRVDMINIKKDWETGYVDDWDYVLTPYTESHE